MQIAHSMNNLGTETAFEVLGRARALEAKGHNVVHLEIGEPDFDTPENIRNAAKQALDDGFTHYGPANGQPALREAIADEVKASRGVDVDPNNIVVTPGGKPIIFFSLLACVNPGDEVIYPNPGFPIYESVINWMGARTVPLPIREENDFSIDVEELESLITAKTTMIIINSPANPTGGVISHGQMGKIAELAVKHDLTVLTDEIYSRIIYDDEHISLLNFDGMMERTIMLDGFSKTYAMTGWRAGYGIMPREIAPWVSRLMVNSNSCTNSFVQMACVEALRGPQDAAIAMVKEFRKRRQVVVNGINAIEGMSCRMPAGAFYAFANIKELPLSSKESEDYFLDECKVATLSGTSFGSWGEGYLRLSYANSVENIREALDRIAKGVAKL